MELVLKIFGTWLFVGIILVVMSTGLVDNDTIALMLCIPFGLLIAAVIVVVPVGIILSIWCNKNDGYYD